MKKELGSEGAVFVTEAELAEYAKACGVSVEEWRKFYESRGIAVRPASEFYANHPLGLRCRPLLA